MYEYRPDGVANFYHITKDGKWVAVVQMNGELTTVKQEWIMQAMIEVLNANKENN